MKKCIAIIATTLVIVQAETVRLTPERSISEAMVKIRAGDTLLLSPGVFKESIVLKDKVTLLGAGIEQTTIKGDGRNSVVIINGSAVLGNLTVSGGQNGIQVQSATARIDSVAVVENRGSGILAVRALPEMNALVVARNGGNGIQAATIGGGSMILEKITIAENGGYGIEYDGTVPLSITSVLFYKNNLKAIRDTENQVVASKNGIYPEQKEYVANNRTGKPIFVENGSKGLYQQIKESPCYGSGYQFK